MIDYEARREAVHVLDRLISARISNWQLEDEWPISDNDPSLNCILRWLWTLYNDDEEVVMLDVLDKNAMRILKRCREFLSANIEFKVKQLSLLEEKEEKRKWGKEWRTDCSEPENEFWPFPS